MVCYNPLIGFRNEGIVTSNGKLKLIILGSLANYQHLEGKSGYELCHGVDIVTGKQIGRAHV